MRLRQRPRTVSTWVDASAPMSTRRPSDQRPHGRTGQRVDVPEKFVVTFKPGKEMEEKVRQLEEAAAKEAIDKQTVPSPAPVETSSS